MLCDMAKRQITQFIDDLDGTTLEEGEGATIRFSLKGRSFDIDLSAENAQKLEDALAPFITVARPVSPVAKSERARSGDRKTDLANVRQWADSNGFAVSERGRVPKNVLEAYEAANNT